MKCALCQTPNPTYDLRPYPPVGDQAFCLQCIWKTLQHILRAQITTDEELCKLIQALNKSNEPTA